MRSVRVRCSETLVPEPVVERPLFLWCSTGIPARWIAQGMTQAIGGQRRRALTILMTVAATPSLSLRVVVPSPRSRAVSQAMAIATRMIDLRLSASIATSCGRRALRMRAEERERQVCDRLRHAVPKMCLVEAEMRVGKRCKLLIWRTADLARSAYEPGSSRARQIRQGLTEM